ncbi:hypothetical protein DEA98_29600 (plasmid) [Brucella pseudogrignonensis]|nr:hypothetical protein [Brucella pseudogrignonensis]
MQISPPIGSSSAGRAERPKDRAGEDGPSIDQKEPQNAEKQRRGMFAGLKLNARSVPPRSAVLFRGQSSGRKERELAAGAGARPAGRASAAAVAA